MPAYDYVALDASGKRQRGILEADSDRLARAQLREKQLIPVEVSESRKKQSGSDAGFSLFQSVSVNDLSLFTRHLATLVQSGIPLEEALHATARQTRHRRLQSVVMSLRSRVLEGHSLADGLRDFPRVFSPVFRSLVASGEQSGDLGQVLDQLADYTENAQKLRSTVTQAMVYPIALTVVAILVIGVLMVYVVPKVVAQFDHYGQTLPLLTRILITISEAMANYWMHALVLLGLLMLAGRWWMKDEGRRKRVHKRLLRLPVVGDVLLSVDSARMLHTLGILLASGVSLIEAIKVGLGTLNNLHLQEGMAQVANDVREGKSFSFALQQMNELPPMAVYMITSGEQSGELDTMVRRSADNLAREVEARVSIMTSLLEPLLIVGMGLVVVTIVLAILLPILQLNNLSGF
ncbi:general secretion pathway protein F [Litorivivens lipolytica]|uniref:General secretion pathway protein F n=1 Tax=Litorivivens lipolytica TaxID=1524264 RepID=A0A7W4W5W7_9GAMM|nr:type II secretion system inner membrane protein GspF [Litorivivens lipolytica]MBB3048068.1 general secretion pathway protein F [Litorivivens lipolytica]